MTAAPEQSQPPGSVAVSQWFASRAGGLATPVAATMLAFLIGGLIVAIDGTNPVTAYRAIFEGTGLNWFFPWVSGDARADAARDLQQTLLVSTPLILTAIAVAFAFRCGLFNIGGQGQLWVGLIAAIWFGTHFEGMPRPLHVLLALVAATIAGVIWGGIAGVLKATVGAHEVISTIMLNWIAIFGGKYLFEVGGPLQGAQESLPRSAQVFDSAKLWPIWGNIQALHAGLFIALFALVVYHLILNRTTLGYEVRAVGFNAEAARYGGISVSRNYFLVLGIAGGFAGLAGGIDVLGWRFDVDTSNFTTNTVGFTGIAVALLGRNKAVGILLAGLLFGALQVGTSSRQLDPRIFDPALASDLAIMIQALVIFFIGAEVLIVSLWRAGRIHRPRRRVHAGVKP
jgi:simple sugar transport system permease protein